VKLPKFRKVGADRQLFSSPKAKSPSNHGQATSSFAIQAAFRGKRNEITVQSYDSLEMGSLAFRQCREYNSGCNRDSLKSKSVFLEFVDLLADAIELIQSAHFSFHGGDRICPG
jgi:hypothetical protein